MNVARWLLSESVDVIISGDDLRVKAPGYVLAEAGVGLWIGEAGELNTAMNHWTVEGCAPVSRRSKFSLFSHQRQDRRTILGQFLGPYPLDLC